ncbi:hypothetical protein AAG570_010067 [Ranatra chinensis]|uniref:Uncharacterized protein n=1 Tax=Ranatra chinensis TaxID=642074 RepID=A0ABD0YNN1_9HEMI
MDDLKERRGYSGVKREAMERERWKENKHLRTCHNDFEYGVRMANLIELILSGLVEFKTGRVKANRSQLHWKPGRTGCATPGPNHPSLPPVASSTLRFPPFYQAKITVSGEKRSSNDEGTVEKWLSEMERSAFDERIKKLVPRLKKCVEADADYVEQLKHILEHALKICRDLNTTTKDGGRRRRTQAILNYLTDWSGGSKTPEHTQHKRVFQVSASRRMLSVTKARHASPSTRLKQFILVFYVVRRFRVRCPVLGEWCALHRERAFHDNTSNMESETSETFSSTTEDQAPQQDDRGCLHTLTLREYITARASGVRILAGFSLVCDMIFPRTWHTVKSFRPNRERSRLAVVSMRITFKSPTRLGGRREVSSQQPAPPPFN